MTERICIPTQLGELVAYPINETDYPGIHIYLKRGNDELLLAMVEVSQVLDWGNVCCTVYGDAASEAPTYVDRIFRDELDEYYDSIANS